MAKSLVAKVNLVERLSLFQEFWSPKNSSAR